MGLKIEDIGRPEGIRKKGKRVGRGIGSGRGKTCGKGHKGAKARSGGGTYNPGFEGGQMPLMRRIPKRGFTNKFKKEWSLINVGVLEAVASVKDGTIVDKDFLLKNDLLKRKKFPIKVLCKGELKKSITVKAEAFSGSAKKAIEDAGGKVELV
ncbi:MAG: 50S ribosomal protein L15 [Candidatus Omnitrophica bacterium]|nr:50S ribosomal protein L15 [Candidatus Omnitrophota bacterium]MBU1128448.1 50S ribosomal protein L15 [Candidatus Omnitrophota bacterium]MBU1657188.1 50S ribosomal protein L15 [Candidatus Omnitrophota bacterium]MBU1784438.1 50S ribosomal protein L15 [Candidatus Omnitrophota bacterium]MBU1851641.1 50S ribosomal protein L15 [Candidatus Omnitrophota bacterium]